MSAEKRQFSDFTQFPGEIVDGVYAFPRLYHTDSNKNTRMWSINVRLIKGKEKKYGIDWDLMKDDTVPVLPKYLEDASIPDGTITQMWVETGVIDGKLSRHAPTYPKIKNAGRSNERNQFEQGLVEARSHYLKKVENGLRQEAEFNKLATKTPRKKGQVAKPVKHSKYFPMLVRKYDDEKKHLTYPLYVQPKLDGARLVVFLNKSPRQNPTIENVIMYTRQKKDYIGFNPIREELLPALIDMWDFTNKESIYIDGELYKHGMNLQDISGAVRNPDRMKIPKYAGIKFHVFDVFYPHSLHLTFKDRLEYLDDVFCAAQSSDTSCLMKVPTFIAKNEKEQESLYARFLKDKYEGAILRNVDSLYLTHPTKNSMQIRSKFVLKRKMRYSAEFEVIGFDQGTKGRDKGAIMWVCSTPDTHKEFNVTPKNITYDERYELFKKASANKGQGFITKYKGRLMTVEYEDLSKDQIPLRAKAIGFREHI